MTGAEIVLKQGNEYYLFKVRHDGYFVEDYFKESKMAFKYSFEDTMKEFEAAFMKDYGCIGSEIETNFPQGFKTTLKKNYDFKKLYLKGTLFDVSEAIQENLEKECENKKIDTDEEGLFCGYQDYCVFLDFDKKLLYGLLNEDDNEVIYDEYLKEA